MEPGTERVVTCTVDGETYAVPALSVREVVRWMPVTRIPHGGAAIKGVINLRGEIVPLIDLRVQLGLPVAEPGDRTCVIVVSMARQGGRLQAGLIVDAALEVVRLPPADAGDAGAAHAGRYVAGIARAKGGLILVLDCETLITDALGAVAAAV